MEPTGSAWLPIAVFFNARGHAVYRVSSQKAADLRRFLSRHAKSNGIDADTLARLPLIDPDGLAPLRLPGSGRAALDRRVRACDRLTMQASEHKVRLKDLVRQLMPLTPLTGELGQADRTFPHGRALQVLPRPGASGVGDRRHRPQGTAHVLGPAPGCFDQRSSAPPTTPQTRPPAREDLLPADGRTRRESPQSAVRRRGTKGRTRLGRHAPTHALRHLRHVRRTRHTRASPADHRRDMDGHPRRARPPTIPQDHGGEGPSASPHGTRQVTREASTNEATLPTPDRRRVTRARQGRACGATPTPTTAARPPMRESLMGATSASAYPLPPTPTPYPLPPTP
jgi:hypothetical protein